jgi:hypothetical protein
VPCPHHNTKEGEGVGGEIILLLFFWVEVDLSGSLNVHGSWKINFFSMII